MKYLVTGGNGFIGNNLVKSLLDRGDEVTVLDDLSRGAKTRVPIEDFIYGDICDGDTVFNAAAGVDRIIHLAYVQGTQNFYSKPRQVWDVAVQGMINVLHACEFNGAELILCSSSEAYQVADKIPTDESVPLIVPDPLNSRYSYGGGKITSELMSLAYAWDGAIKRLVIVRPHNIYGPDMGWEHVIPQLSVKIQKSNKDLEALGTGDETRSFCYVSDFVKQFLAAVDYGENCNIYHLGNPEEITINDLVKLMLKYFRKNLNIINSPLAKGSPPRRNPDISKILKLTPDLYPSIDIKTGLDLTLDWYGNRNAS